MPDSIRLRIRFPKRPASRRAFAFGMLCLSLLWVLLSGETPGPASLGAVATGPASCTLQGSAVAGRLERVIDGDTLVLADGQHVRLIGLNTPETHDPRTGMEPLGPQATQRLQALLADGALQWQAGEDAHDHYHRLLADIFTPQGELLAERLVREGLAFAVYFPPNLRYAGCLADAEQQARDAGLGVWAEPVFGPWQATAMAGATPGFRRLQGTVARVDESRRALWIQLDGDAVLQLPAHALPLFADDPPQAWVGRVIEVTGWLVDRQKDKAVGKRGFSRWMMLVRYPASVRNLTKA